VPTRTVLEAWQRRMRSQRVDALAAALLSEQVGGGDLATLLARFGAAAAERDRADADARSATAQARFTGLLVVAMPVGAGVLAELLEPGFVVGLVGDPLAATVLACAAGLQLVGFAAIRRLSRITAS
jgi:tight adherence protein B